MTAKQLALGLKPTARFDQENFVISPQNQSVLNRLLHQKWPHNIGVLSGAEGVGKTHLAYIWGRLVGAQRYDPIGLRSDQGPLEGPLTIDHMDQHVLSDAAEEQLFHLHNGAIRTGHFILFIGRGAAENWPLRLADLRSRLKGSVSFELAPPNEVAMTQILTKLFMDRGIDPAPKALAYLINRMPRSVRAAEELVDHLDSAAMAQRRSITLPFVAQEFKSWLTAPEK